LEESEVDMNNAFKEIPFSSAIQLYKQSHLLPIKLTEILSEPVARFGNQFLSQTQANLSELIHLSAFRNTLLCPESPYNLKIFHL
jgi:hypothetical protein